MSDLVKKELDALVVAQQVSQLKGLGETLVKSGLLPASIKTPEAAVVIILKGRELGIPPMEALNSINVIQGKPTVAPQLMLALIYRSGQGSIQIVERTETRSVVRAHRLGQQPQEFVFTLEDARKLGLAEKDNYKKQSTVMLQWRNVAAAARAVFPDVVAGLYTPEEMGAEVEVNEDGSMTIQAGNGTPISEPDVIEAEVVKTAPAALPKDDSELATAKQVGKIQALFKELGIGDDAHRDLRLFVLGNITGKKVESSKDLSIGVARSVIEALMGFQVACTEKKVSPGDCLEAYAAQVCDGSWENPASIVADYAEVLKATRG